MPGMGGPGGPGGGDFGGIDFSKLAGAGGEGMPDFGSMGTAIDPDNVTGGADEADDGDEDDMPALEEVKDTPAAPKA